MCAHCSTYYQLMLNPEKSLSLFLLSSLGQVPFYLSVLLYSWLLCSCASSRTAALYTEDVVIIFCLLYVFLLSFFSAFCWQLIYSFQEKRIASVNFSAMETNHFFCFWIFCSWCLTDLFCKGSLSSKLISARFELTSVKCLVLFLFWLDLAKYLPDFYSDKETMALSPVLVIHVPSVVCF